MYMDSNQLYIDKVVNFPVSGISETKSATLQTAYYNSTSVSTTFPFTTPSIGSIAGYYSGSIRFTVTGNVTCYCTGYLTLGGTYRPLSSFASSISNTSFSGIALVSGSHAGVSADDYTTTKTYSGTKDLRSYVRIA